MDGHIFTRYSRFSKYGNQVIATPVADTVDFKRSFEQGPVLKFKVPRKGDLIKEIMLHIKLSDIDETTLPYIGFTSPFPFYMFQKIDLVVGDTIIETLTPDYMLYQLYTTNNQYQNDGYAYCVGNIKALIDNTKYGQDASTREDENLYRDFKREFTFPLPFYFHKVISSAIPLCALTKQEVEVHFHMRGLYNFLNIIDKDTTYVFPNNDTIEFKDINERGELTQEIQERLSNLKIEVFDVLVDFVYIDDSAVEKIQSSPVSFFINQSQLRRFENEKGTRFGNPYIRHRLDFINPIKDIFFYLVKSSELYQGPTYVTSHRFTLRQGGYKFGHTVKNCEIIADNSVLLSNKVADYNFLNQIQPFVSHTMTLKPAISFQQPYFYTYSFALDPENNLPTGYFNPNAYKNVELNITYNTHTLDLVNDRTLFVYARSINILTISDGVSELLFENPQLKEYY